MTLAFVACNAAFPADFTVTRIPVPGGEVVCANPGEREELYDKLNYAAARRAGNFL